MTDNQFAAQFLADILERSRKLKEQCDLAMKQISNDEFFARESEQSNSVAILVKHLSGNFISRWTDFLNSDGEKPNRKRDNEFIITDADSRANLTERWEEGWNLFLETAQSLDSSDLAKSITIRSQSMSVLQALNRAFEHIAFHTGQIVLLSKKACGDRWQSLSIELGKSEAFNAQMGYRSTVKPNRH